MSFYGRSSLGARRPQPAPELRVCTCSFGSRRPSEASRGARHTLSLRLSLETAACARGGPGWLDGGFYICEGDVHPAADDRVPFPRHLMWHRPHVSRELS